MRVNRFERKTNNLSVLYEIILIFIICSYLIQCASCNYDNDDKGETDQRRNEGIVIETLDPDAAATIPPFEVHESEYEAFDCLFSDDSDLCTITARYDDTDNNPNGYVIDYDLTYYDYGAESVSVYTTDKLNTVISIPLDRLESQWTEVTTLSSGVLSTVSDSGERQESLYNSALDYVVAGIDSDPDISELAGVIMDKYDLFDEYFSYPYPVETMNNTEVEGEYFYLTSPTGVSNIEFTYTDALRFVVLRDSLHGLPVGVPSENEIPYHRIRYGNYYGSLMNLHRDIDGCQTDFYSVEANILVDYINYRREAVSPCEDSVKPIPLIDCIENSINGILYIASQSDNHYSRVYAAELVYLPFAVNCSGPDYWDYEIYYVPVWAIYTVSEDLGTMYPARVAVVYLNAMNGELVSHGL